MPTPSGAASGRGWTDTGGRAGEARQTYLEVYLVETIKHLLELLFVGWATFGHWRLLVGGVGHGGLAAGRCKRARNHSKLDTDSPR